MNNDIVNTYPPGLVASIYSILFPPSSLYEPSKKSSFYYDGKPKKKSGDKKLNDISSSLLKIHMCRTHFMEYQGIIL
jgi:hypothetical protein